MDEGCGGRSIRTARLVFGPMSQAVPVDNPPSVRQWCVAASLCLVLSIGAFGRALNGGMLWDDRLMISDNTTLRTAEGLKAIWTSPGATFQYYPLTYTSFWWEYRLWADAPFGYRCISLLLHAAAALLLWRLLTGLAARGALVAALLWCVHPVQVESVSWIAERKTVLSGLFYWASLALLWPAFSAGSNAWRQRRTWLGALSFIAALLAKTSAVTLPALLLVLIWMKHGRVTRAIALQTLPLFGAAAALSAMTIAVERQLTLTAHTLHALTAIDRVAIAGTGLWHYTLKAMFPWPLMAIYPRMAPTVWGVVLFAAWLLIPLALLRGRGTIGRAPAAAAVAFAILLAPTLGFVDFGFMQASWVADRFLYLPCAALIALVVHALAGRVPRGAAMALLAICCLLSAQRAGVFANEIALWNDTLKKNPSAWMAHVQLAFAALRSGQTDLAIQQMRSAEKLQPDSDVVQHRLGVALLRAGRSGEALVHLDRAVTLSAGNLEARNDRANVWADSGRLDAAIAEYERLLQLAPPRAETLTNLGNALMRAKRGDEAAQRYSQATLLDPGYAAGWNGRGALLLSQGRFDEALVAFSQAAALVPREADYRFNRGLALSRLGRWEAAVAAYRDALEIQPKNPAARHALVLALVSAGDLESARREVIAGQRLGVSYPPELLARVGM